LGAVINTGSGLFLEANRSTRKWVIQCNVEFRPFRAEDFFGGRYPGVAPRFLVLPRCGVMHAACDHVDVDCGAMDATGEPFPLPRSILGSFFEARGQWRVDDQRGFAEATTTVAMPLWATAREAWSAAPWRAFIFISLLVTPPAGIT
jgi:hypothetical protein